MGRAQRARKAGCGRAGGLVARAAPTAIRCFSSTCSTSCAPRGVLDGDAQLAALEELGDVVPESLRLADRATSSPGCSEREREVLEAASLIGHEFSAAAVASALGEELVEVEPAPGRTCRYSALSCAAPASARFPTVWSRTPTPSCTGLFRTVLEGGVSPGRRQLLQRRLGERGEGGLRRPVPTRSPSSSPRTSSRAAIRARPSNTCSCRLTNAARRWANREARGRDRARPRAVLGGPRQRVAGAARGALRAFGACLGRASGEMHAAAGAFEAMAAAARELDVPDREVEALLYAASALSWVDREGLSGPLGARPQRARRRQPRRRLCGAYWNLLFHGWSERDFERSTAAVEASAGEAKDRIRMLHRVRSSFFLSWSGTLRAGRAPPRSRAARWRCRSATPSTTCWGSSSTPGLRSSPGIGSDAF